jgi:hypothetical protein
MPVYGGHSTGTTQECHAHLQPVHWVIHTDSTSCCSEPPNTNLHARMLHAPAFHHMRLVCKISTNLSSSC